MSQANDQRIDKTAGRRLLLRTSLAALASVSLWKFIPLGNSQDTPLRAFASRLIRTLGLHKFASIPHTLALTNLARFSEQELALSLTALLKVDLTRDKQIFGWSETQLREHLNAIIVNDYRAGLLVQLHGWWISKTESLCFALLNLH